ncbi:MAG TPA: hypothetical protein VHC70_15720 [Phycisphaerales bacterium]|jgi:hypothetical protein|nr:hypothetical protein [Phycisphaerales bacterium]
MDRILQRIACSLLVLGVLLGAMGNAGCSRQREYSQSSPDETLKSAIAMIKAGDTRRLSDLIYAEGPEMRAVLNRLGGLLGDMQKLSVASAKRFPADFQKLQDDAAAAAADPKNKSLVGQLMVSMGSFDPSRAGSHRPSPDDLRNAFSALLADPYGWLERNAPRLSTIKTADDTASVMFDGEPAIPVVGLPMKRENGRWYIVLPINMPPISNVMPRTKDQWSILGSVLHVTDNAVRQLTDDVNRGGVAGLKNLTDKFQEKILFPIAIAFAAYAKELDVVSRVDRRLNAVRSRSRAWIEARAKAGGEDAPRVSPRLAEAIMTVAPERIEKIVRANKPLRVDSMNDAEFEELVSGWLADAGLHIRFDQDLGPDQVDKAISAWREERKSRLASGKPGKGK